MYTKSWGPFTSQNGFEFLFVLKSNDKKYWIEKWKFPCHRQWLSAISIIRSTQSCQHRFFSSCLSLFTFIIVECVRFCFKPIILIWWTAKPLMILNYGRIVNRKASPSSSHVLQLAVNYCRDQFLACSNFWDCKSRTLM